MFKNLSKSIIPLFIFIAFLSNDAFGTNTAKEQIDGVLFYKTDCAECIELISRDLPAILKKTDSKITLLAVNNATETGGTIYLQSLLERGLPGDLDLPVLHFESEYTSGRDKIVAVIKTAIDTEQTYTPVDWLPQNALNTASNYQSNDPQSAAFFRVSADTTVSTGLYFPDFKGNFLKDPIANSLAIVVLIMLGGSLVYSIKNLKSYNVISEMEISNLIPLLASAAIMIAGYLFYSGIVDNSLACGPVGHCNTVQQSEYAVLFGVIPVSLLGILGYLGIIAAWGGAKYGRKALRGDCILLIWLFAAISTAFFIYLTFLEPFIIGATCIWCLTAAVITITVLVLSTKPAASVIHGSNSTILGTIFTKERKT